MRGTPVSGCRFDHEWRRLFHRRSRELSHRSSSESVAGGLSLGERVREQVSAEGRKALTREGAGLCLIYSPRQLRTFRHVQQGTLLNSRYEGTVNFSFSVPLPEHPWPEHLPVASHGPNSLVNLAMCCRHPSNKASPKRSS